MLLFYFFHESPVGMRPEQVREAQITEAKTRSVHPEEGEEEVKSEEKEDEILKRTPLDKRALREITRRWEKRVKDYLLEIINDGSRRDEDFLITIAMGSTPGFREEFMKIMNSRDKGLRFISAVGLVNVGDDSGLSSLDEALKTGTWQAKLIAAKTLAMKGDERGFNVVMEICRHPDWGARIEAVRTLGYFKSGSGKGALFGYLSDTDEHIRTAAAGALAMLGEEQGINYLKKNLSHYDPAIKIYSAEVLARMKDSAPAYIFIREIGSEDPYERIHGAVYLMVLGDGRGIDIVQNALNNPDENTERYALELLGENIRYLQ